VALTSESVQELLSFLRERGSDLTEIEVKLGAGGCPTLGPTLCAFGNTPGGGTILIGLDEGDGFSVVGVEDPAMIEQGIASQARTAIAPPVQVSFDEAVIDGSTLVIASVAALPSNQRPCRYQGNAYLRQADGDYVMSEQEIQQILAQRERPRYDALPVDGTSPRDLDQGLVREFLTAAKGSSRRLASVPDEEILRRRAVVAPDGERLTLAGLYALGSYPQQFVPSLSITAAVKLDARTGERTRDLVHLDGPIPDLLEAAMAWVQRNTHTTVRFGADGHGRDESEIPMIAVRELVANALVHRDLGPHTTSKRVELRLADDKLVISNPGGLYGVSRQQLGTPNGKSAVNEFLYDICKLTRTSSGARVIEGEGGGIAEVQRVLRSANLQPPRFIDRGVGFTVLVPRHSLISPTDLEWLTLHDPSGSLTPMQKQILTSMRHGQVWTNSLVRAEFPPIDSIDARSALQALVTAGFATAMGERGQTSYMVADQWKARSDGGAVPAVVMRVPASQQVPEQDALPIGDPGLPPVGEVTRNGPTVLAALANAPRNVSELVEFTGLTANQVRYALSELTASGHVRINGGQGRRDTTYSRVPL
jgi:ATP-dependent DNA helicase RecG